MQNACTVQQYMYSQTCTCTCIHKHVHVHVSDVKRLPCVNTITV